MPSDGFFVGSIVFDDVSPEMVIGREEIFGPVAGIHRVNTLDDAFRIMEAHPNANAFQFYTDGKVTISRWY